MIAMAPAITTPPAAAYSVELFVPLPDRGLGGDVASTEGGITVGEFPATDTEPVPR